MHRFSLRVSFADVDAAGLVYYPRFFHFCHLAFEDLFNRQGSEPYHELIGKRNLGFPTVHVEADYKIPLRFGDVITVVLGFKEVKNSSNSCDYQFFKQEELCFRALITTVCIDVKHKSKVSLPPDLRKFFAQFSSHEEK